uniref:NADH-ubiquinone oxidoreductase chain 6 n=1 Tax=Palaestes abruptus TaxID=2528286 RepID=A0A7G7MUA6_9CUCU|nr:NADH dehydrogenase subunit 6 [Palaestes abruptus]QNG56285.1 NADH dehydrogenase subunit 6 [Palaestes abruptus]QNG56415.1 NADH dehydrogenase subunit 6 [Palaestes abruptus]
MMNFMILMTWILSFLFLFMNHPLSFGSILFLQTISISLITGLMSLNFWYSYILFLIMVGGMLILFMYMTSIASNEKFKISIKLTSLLLFFLISMPLMFQNINMKFFNENFLNQNFQSMFSLSMNKYMFIPSIIIYFMIIIYLFITLIAVVKIINIKYGPLRQKF